MIVKICGITNAPDAAAACDGGAGAIGFNFYARSPRFIEPERAAKIATPGGVLRVGVFVGERPARVEEIARIAALDVAQLHGDEGPDDYPESLRVWKAVRVTAGLDITSYADVAAEALLLDGPAGETYGGSGKAFDWRLAGYMSGVSIPLVILAGGLDASNVAKAVSLVRPWGVDACSRIEASPGRKDHEKMKAFLQAAREALGA